jgi:flavin reductase (DIM6/NTAB) family NADH-FMN oxidoreductase RutF
MPKIRLPNQPIGPFPAMIVGAMVNGRPTYTTVGAGGCACLAPVLCASLKNTHYITGGIEKTGSFSVNIPNSGLVRETDHCGIVSGWDADKSGIFRPFFDEAGEAPMIEECPLNFLCRVRSSTEIDGFTMFFGDIVAAFASEGCLANGAGGADGRPDAMKIDPLIMIAQSYCNLGGAVGRVFQEGRKEPNGA